MSGHDQVNQSEASHSPSNVNHSHSHSQSQETEAATSNYHEFDNHHQSQSHWDGGEATESQPNLEPSPSEMQHSKSNSTILPTTTSTSLPRLNTSSDHQDDNSNTISPPSSPSNANLGRDVMVSIPEPVMPHTSPKPRSSISSHTSPRRTSLLSLPPTTFQSNDQDNNALAFDDHRRSSIPSISGFASTNSGGSTFESDGFITSSPSNGLLNNNEVPNNNSSNGEEDKTKTSIFSKLWPSNSQDNPNSSGGVGGGPRLRHNRGLSEIESIEKDGGGSSTFSIDFKGLGSNDSHSILQDSGPASPIATGNASGTSYGDSFSISHRPGGKTPLLNGASKKPIVEKLNYSNGSNGPYGENPSRKISGLAIQTNGLNNNGMSERNVGIPQTVSANGYGPGYGYSPYGSSTTSSATLKNPTLPSSQSNHGYPNHSTFSSPFGSKYGITLNGSPNSKNLNQKDKEGFEALLKATESPFSWDTKDGQEEFDDYLHQESDDENTHNNNHYNNNNNNSRAHSKISLASSNHRKPNKKKSLLPGLRAILNVGTLIILIAALLMLFAGYPIIDGTKYLHSTGVNLATSSNASFNAGAPLHVGNLNDYDEFPSLIDPVTPKDVYEKLSVDGQTKLKLVFSDEFETDGRSFYPGDDPYWEAVDLWYWGTNNYEWYDPAAITTKDGSLQITLSEQPIHDLNFRGGMIQSWNKFCFTGGLLEASVRLPGYSDVSGLWPAFWMMGNLGRAGYGASLEGLWPYSYEACDVGTIYNQTTPEGIPASNARGGRTAFNGKYNTESLSWLQGQRLSACTCAGEDHPGPKLSDGSFKGRGAVEIDVFEAQVGKGKADPSIRTMQVSQSAQFAPFNDQYTFANTTGPAYDLFTPLSSEANTYKGAAYQQSGSIVSDTLAGSTEKGAFGIGGGGGFATYGTEYTTGAQGSATWINNGNPSFRINPAALEPDPVSQISNRVMASEPMYIIFNLGISQNFGTPNWNRLQFPNTMSVDWVRVYQPEDSINVGCDPSDYPTQDYINRHPEAYSNAQLQFWGEGASGYGQDWPLNNQTGCSAAHSKAGVQDDANPHRLAPYVAQSQLPPF